MADDFAVRVKERREHLRMSQNDLAEKADLAPAALSRILSGDRAPRMEHILALAAALDMTVVELTAGTDVAALLEEWVPRARYDTSEHLRLEAEARARAMDASVSALEAEANSLRSECSRLRSDLAEQQNRAADMAAKLAGEQARCEASDRSLKLATRVAQDFQLKLAEAEQKVRALRHDIERSGQAQVASGALGAALGALLVGIAAGKTPPSRR